MPSRQINDFLIKGKLRKFELVDRPEKEPLFHAVSCMEDDWGEKDVEEKLGVEGDLLVDQVVDVFDFTL